MTEDEAHAWAMEQLIFWMNARGIMPWHAMQGLGKQVRVGEIGWDNVYEALMDVLRGG